jgi:hypothetical protein
MKSIRYLIPTLLFASTAALAEDAASIIDRARTQQRVNNGIQQITMVLVSKSGSSRERTFEMRIRKDGEIVRSYVRFSKPSDVAGTQLVMVDHPDKIDEQLLYLPALKRTNRIAGRARKGAFMGSDFAYEDLEVSDSKSATHTMVSQTDAVWVIDSTPPETSSYGRIRSHVSKTDLMIRTVEFFNTKGEPLKRLDVSETASENGVTIPIKSVMKNIKRGTSTQMNVSDYRLNVSAEEIPDETFTVGFLERNG